MTMITALGSPQLTAVPLAEVAVMIAAAVSGVLLLIMARARLQQSMKRVPAAVAYRFSKR